MSFSYLVISHISWDLFIYSLFIEWWLSIFFLKKALKNTGFYWWCGTFKRWPEWRSFGGLTDGAQKELYCGQANCSRVPGHYCETLTITPQYWRPVVFLYIPKPEFPCVSVLHTDQKQFTSFKTNSLRHLQLQDFWVAYDECVNN